MDKLKTGKARSVILQREFFSGDIDDWKRAFYSLWFNQMLTDYAYSIELCRSAKLGAYVRIVYSATFDALMPELLDDLGYTRPIYDDCFVGVVTYDSFNAPIDAVRIVTAILT